ncbi:hypothetical protein [Micromonospora carbonacea]|uniref:hypothetical protein n=1 Tax=Micromonospora carbonacea TaxID=47853 RepID=UPI003711E3B9
MEPITVMILAALITKVVTTHREDMEYARHGQESPRYKMKLAKLAAAQKAGGAGGRAPVKPGASGYMQELWRDAWDDLTEHRRRQRETRNAGKRQQHEESLRDWSKRSLNTRPDGRPVDDMIDVAGVRPGKAEKGGRIPQPPTPEPSADVVHDAEWPPPADPDDAGGFRRDKRLVACGHCGTSVSAGYRRTRTVNGDRRKVCAPCAERIDHGDLTVPAGITQHSDIGCSVCGQHRDDPWCEHRKAAYQRLQEAVQGALNAEKNPPADDAPDKCNRCPYGRITGTRPWPGSDGSSPDADQLCNRCGWLSSHMSGKTWDQWSAELNQTANPSPWPPPQPDPKPADPIDVDPTPNNVIPLFPNAKETVMTANAEATGLPTAIAYAEAAAQAHDAFATAGSEGYTSALASFEVGSEGLDSARAAQEASTNAAAAWRVHHETLVKQMAGREFYQSNPDAGNKAFLSGE